MNEITFSKISNVQGSEVCKDAAMAELPGDLEWDLTPWLATNISFLLLPGGFII